MHFLCTVQVWEGNGVVASARKLIGATNPLASEPGTIRGDFAIEVGRNIIHGSDSVENGERETGARSGNYYSGEGGLRCFQWKASVANVIPVGHDIIRSSGQRGEQGAGDILLGTKMLCQQLPASLKGPTLTTFRSTPCVTVAAADTPWGLEHAA
jgi:hypothetical protein